MKKLTLLIVLALIIQAILLSQPCLPEGITFTTQVQIDNFQTDYPNCSEILGEVIISGNEITSLNGLNVLTSISEYLSIENNNILTNLSGLENLTTIQGDLNIGNWNLWPAMYGNPSLISLDGLDNLAYIGGSLFISFNDVLARKNCKI